ncbi:hypothetical protein SAMN02745181_1306 [Rubritalea squalenifaciens DSM 18772]|uniref:Cadherin domain-containing protein n=1 Tax=Rubritalea squalenifaciens DSM 18772 TaxID=1123071 RepID=A0A1M6GYA0_9BACT|nr:cadherin repeat domain-containing protein [Rubritalea squalenifaciens]SHJ14948.1 hypothetical protein SAMN02745181_1306 [Rubritalea squalenifaciens DSM 18772]
MELRSLLTLLLTATAASAFPFDSSQDDLPSNVAVTGAGSRTEGVVETYNIPITDWPDRITLTVQGADGGRAKATNNDTPDKSGAGGGGAHFQVSFNIDPADEGALRPGGQLRFIPGSKGETQNKSEIAAGGGGGGSGVFYRAPLENAQWEPLIIAGGGGGAAAVTKVGASSNFGKDGGNANLEISGDDSSLNGGDNGTSGGSYVNSATRVSDGAGGGGGWLNGITGTVEGNAGRNDVENPIGGFGGAPIETGSDGGHGCGGGGAGYRYDGNGIYGSGGGGGGGYSGGGAGSHTGNSSLAGGGGGGSYVDSRAIVRALFTRNGDNQQGFILMTSKRFPGSENTSLAAPVITLSPSTTVEIAYSQYLADFSAALPEFSATDVYGNSVTVTPGYNTQMLSGIPGSYGASYGATDQFGSSVIVGQTITLLAPTKPTFRIAGNQTAYEDSGKSRIHNFATNFNTHDQGQSFVRYDVTNDNNDLFEIQPWIDASGQLTFETRDDAHGTAKVTVIGIDDENLPDYGASEARIFTITILNVPDLPFIRDFTASIAENTTTATTVIANDPLGGTLTYSLPEGSEDNALFLIDPATGALSFLQAPDFEDPRDVGGADADNTYEVVVAVTNTDGTTTRSSGIAVTNVDEAPVNLALSNQSIAENETSIGTLSATDPESFGLTFSITPGSDSARFAIDPSSGALSFITAADFENPSDADTDNIYLVTLSVSDGENTTSALFAITVVDRSEGPTDIELSKDYVAEGKTAIGTITATDPAGGTPRFTLAGGDDRSLFTLDEESGALSFISAPDFESPADSDGDNHYEITIRITGDEGHVFERYTIEVYNQLEAPRNVTLSYNQVLENTTAIGTVSAEDPSGGGLRYSIFYTADNDLFTLDSNTGVLSFRNAPDFENPHDSNRDGAYEIAILVENSETRIQKNFTITVLDENESPTDIQLSSTSIEEGLTTVGTITASDPEGSRVFYTGAGGADSSLFTVNYTTGVLSFRYAPDFEAPTDSDGDNIYEIAIRITDNSSSIIETFLITVTNREEPALDEFRSTYGMAVDGSDDFLDWSNNGIKNILYYAFGLGDPNNANIDRSRLPAGSKESDNFAFSYIEPIATGTGISVTPVTSTELSTWQTPTELGELPTNTTTEDLGDGYQRVSLTFPLQSTPRFFSVEASVDYAE